MRINSSPVIGGNTIIGRPVVSAHNFNSELFRRNKNENKNKEIVGVNYVADNSGCGFYRMHWPELLLNSKSGYFISNMKKMVINNPEFYEGTSVVRIQRQVSDNQFKLVKHLRQLCDRHNVRLSYEIDDIPFIEDIPKYNRNRKSYDNPRLRQNILDMMNMSDEVTVTNKFFRDYLKEKLNHDRITVIPNYIPKFWMDNFYDEDKLKQNYNKNKKKPRILYAGSGSHYDGSGRVKDDFSDIIPLVKKTYKEFSWVFFGGISRELIPLYKEGKIEFHNWAHVMQYPYKFRDLKINLAIAPLLDNNFNRAKSDIKYMESAAFGIPCICQDMSTYERAKYKFNTPDDLYGQIKSLTKDAGVYMNACRGTYQQKPDFWLENNLDKWEEFYHNPFNSEKRKKINGLQ